MNSLFRLGLKRTWEDVIKPLAKGKSLKSIFTNKKQKTMKRSYSNLSTNSSTTISASPGVFDDDDGSSVTFNHSWVYPSKAANKHRTLAAKLIRTNDKLQHLKEEVAEKQTYKSLVNKTGYYESHHQCTHVQDLATTMGFFARSTVAPVESTVTESYDVYLKSRRASSCFINEMNHSVNFEILVFKAKCDLVADYDAMLAITSSVPTHGVPAGYYPDDKTTLHAAAFPRVALDSYAFTWNMSPDFRNNYSLVKSKRIRVPPGGRVYVNNTCRFNSIVSSEVFDNANGRGIRHFAGEHLLFFRTKTLPSLGPTSIVEGEIVRNHPGYPAASWSVLTTITSVGGSVVATGVQSTTYGNIEDPNKSNATMHWADDTDQKQTDAQMT